MVKHFRTAKGVFKAVDGVDVDIEPSSIVALLGPSGRSAQSLACVAPVMHMLPVLGCQGQ